MALTKVTKRVLGDEYTSSSSLTSATSITVDTSSADTFTLTAGHSATLNFTNVVVGDLKNLVVTGGGSSYTLTLGNINGSSELLILLVGLMMTLLQRKISYN